MRISLPMKFVSRDDTRAERGGDPQRNRSCDTSVIGREMRVLGLLLPLCRGRNVNTDNIRSFFMCRYGRPSVAHALSFSLIARLILIILKGYL